MSHEFAQRLHDMTTQVIEPESVNDFPDRTLNDLVRLVGDVVAAYLVSIASPAGSDTIPVTPEHTNTRHGEDDPWMVSAEIEDVAFHAHGLPSVEVTLRTVQERIDQVGSVRHFLAAHTTELAAVIMPPAPTSKPFKTASGDHDRPFAAPATIERTQAVLCMIAGLGIPIIEEEVHINLGSVTKDMVRDTGYHTIKIPRLDKIIYVCDETGNATYVFSLQELTALGIPTGDLDHMTKDEKNTLLKAHQGRPLGVRLTYGTKWAEQMAALLAMETLPSKSDYVYVTPEYTDKPAIAPKAPPEYQSVASFAADMHVDYERVLRLIESEGIEPPYLLFGSRVAWGISPAVQEMLRNHPELIRPPATSMSIRAVAQALGCNRKKLTRVAARIGIRPTHYQTSRTDTPYLSKDEIQRVACLPDFKVPEAGADIVCLDTLAADHGVDLRNARSALTTQRIRLRIYKFGELFALGLTQEECVELQKHVSFGGQG